MSYYKYFDKQKLNFLLNKFKIVKNGTDTAKQIMKVPSPVAFKERITIQLLEQVFIQRKNVIKSSHPSLLSESNICQHCGRRKPWKERKKNTMCVRTYTNGCRFIFRCSFPNAVSILYLHWTDWRAPGQRPRIGAYPHRYLGWNNNLIWFIFVLGSYMWLNRTA